MRKKLDACVRKIEEIKIFFFQFYYKKFLSFPFSGKSKDLVDQ